jgi:outer membrane protein TolC
MAGLVDAGRARVTADRELKSAHAALIVDVTRRYFAVVKAERVTAVARAAASRATALTAASKARTGVGLATQLDVLRSELQESHVAAAVAEAEGALAEAQDNLALILGRPPGGPIAIETEIDLTGLEADLAPLPATLEDLVGMALANRTEVSEARDKVTDAARAADVAQSNLLPPLTLDLGYTQRSLSVPGAGSIGPLTSGWHVGLSSTYSINRAAGTAAVGTARVVSGAAERAAMGSARQIEADVRRTYRLWQAAIATVGIERGAVDLAGRERALAEMRLERGLGDTLDVVAAEGNLLEAQTALIGAELERTALALDLRRAVGSLHEGQWP